MQIIWKALRGNGKPRYMFKIMGTASAKEPAGSKYKITFLKFSKTNRPLSIWHNKIKLDFLYLKLYLTGFNHQTAQGANLYSSLSFFYNSEILIEALEAEIGVYIHYQTDKTNMDHTWPHDIMALNGHSITPHG